MLDVSSSGFRLSEANAISDGEIIVGGGLAPGSGSSEHALMPTPVPEAASVATLALAGAWLLRRRRVKVS
jgi:uncharacterized protein (TIGR03382 family)